MRKKERIPKILAEIQKIWEDNPDLRLGQLINNAISSDTVLYYIEDNDLLDYLKRFYYK